MLPSRSWLTAVGFALTALTAVACGDAPGGGPTEPTGAEPGARAGLQLSAASTATIAADGALELEDLCDLTIVKATDPAGPGTVPAPASKLVRLVPAPADTTPATNECDPRDPITGQPVDDGTGHPTKGNGLTITAPGITLDLNGIGLRSSIDVAAVNPSLANVGIFVKGKNVWVTNLITDVTQRSVVGNFSVAFELDANGPEIVGKRFDHDADPRTPKLSNLMGEGMHEGGLVSETSEAVLVKGVELYGRGPAPGMALIRCAAPGNSIDLSRIEGGTALIVEGCSGLTVSRNQLSSRNAGGHGIEIAILGGTNVVTKNRIEDNALNGVDVGAGVSGLTITDNIIRRNAGCGIRVNQQGTSGIITTPNTFSLNGADVCP